MKKDKEVKKENEKTTEKENLGIYLLLGILVAAIIFIVSSLSNREKTNPADLNSPDKKTHVWSQESDSEFVKICYDKYRSQVKDDLQKQENAKTYCRCMLEKMKTKYAEDEVQKMKDSEIKQWDTECREQISNPNGLQ